MYVRETSFDKNKFEPIDVQNLIEHIRERLTTAKACTVFESDLDRVWPREKLTRKTRGREIQLFAKKNGWIATILDPGIRVTFRKASAAQTQKSGQFIARR